MYFIGPVVYLYFWISELLYTYIMDCMDCIHCLDWDACMDFLAGTEHHPVGVVSERGDFISVIYTSAFVVYRVGPGLHL